MCALNAGKWAIVESRCVGVARGTIDAALETDRVALRMRLGLIEFLTHVFYYRLKIPPPYPYPITGTLLAETSPCPT